MTTSTPPRLALRLLAWRLPEPDREYFVGDLLEAFHDQVAMIGASNARRWFWRETLHAMTASWPRAAMHNDEHPDQKPMTSFVQALRLAFRSLTRAPALTALVIATLSLGIGATTSVFSVARAALFASPPYPASDRLALVYEQDKDGSESNVGYETYLDLSREDRVIESAAAMGGWSPTLNDGAETSRLAGQRVTWQFFDVLGVKPMLGRGFTAEEDRQGADRVVVLGHAVWQARFGADSGIVGRSITINGIPYRVIGVLPPTFESLMAPQAGVWTTLRYNNTLSQACRTCRHLRMVARLDAGIAPAAAEQALDAAHARLKSTWPDAYVDAGTRLISIHEFTVRNTRQAMLALLTGVALVALIACFNAASLLLGRALRRESEFAVRVALGASTNRLSMLLLSEGLIIALASAVLGTLLTMVGVDVLLRLAPDGVPRLSQVRIDGGVLLFAGSLSLFTGLAASVLPALALLRGGISSGIRIGARSFAGVARHRLRGTLVAAEVALAVMLVSGSSLLFSSVTKLLSVDGGFETDHRLTMELGLSGPRYADSGVVFQDWRSTLDRVHAVPGVRAAALASQIPLGGNFDMNGLHPEVRGAGSPAEDPYAQRYAVTTRYFEVMGIPLRSGRLLTESDHDRAPLVILLNEAAASSIFPGGSAIGQRLVMGGQTRTVVGVVGNTVHQSLSDAPDFQVYVPSLQWGEEGGMNLVVQADVPPANVFQALRSAIQGAVPGIAISRVASFDRLKDDATGERRFALALFAGFSAVALVLAAAGLFGVLSATVVERTREIGVRTALGASRGTILAMVVRQGMILTTVGLVVGLFGTWGTTRVIASLLYDVGASDPTVLVVVVVSLVVVALVSSALPAWRASRVDPVIALRDG
jgi:putative ABC transport system permease protein